jgi:hypothetical protein
MKTYLVILVLFSLQSCQTNTIDPNGIIGDWGFTYETRSKDANGNYGEWTQINTLIAVPPISFTADGKILYDYKTPDGCCTFRKYKAKVTQLILSDQVACVNALCSDCSAWKIMRLTNNTLELEICSTTQNRYSRINK